MSIESNAPVGVDGSETADSITFASYLGQVVWLMTASDEHKDKPFSMLERRVLPAILLKQFRLYSKGKQPIAFVSWATVSDEVRDKLASGKDGLDFPEWRCGDNLVIVECVSPFGPPDKIKDDFLKSMQENPENKV